MMKKAFLLCAMGLGFMSTHVLGSETKSSGVHFTKKVIHVGSEKITAEIAKSKDQHERGLMYRMELKDGTGMLFIFADEQPRTFWMKNTFIPLSIGYFDASKKLIDIQEMQPVKSEMDNHPPIYPSAGPAQYALEVPPGWFQRKHVKVGDALSY